MKRDRDAGREYAEIWGEAVQANRKLRTILILLAASCVLGVLVLLRITGAEPPRPIVVRVDEVGRAEALAYEAATAQADPLDPTTKYFLHRFVGDFHSRRRATVEEQWTRSLRFLSTELANAAFQRDGAEVASHGGRDRRHRAPGRAGRAPHPSVSRAAPRRDGRLRPRALEGRTGDPARALVAHAPVRVPRGPSLPSWSSTTRWASSSPTCKPTRRS